MTKNELENNIQKIIKLFTENQDKLHNLYTGVENVWPERDVLDSFLDTIKLEKSSETRFVAYTRIWDLKEDPLRLYLENNWKSEKEIQDVLSDTYQYVKSYHFDIHKQFIKNIESEIHKWWWSYHELSPGT